MSIKFLTSFLNGMWIFFEKQKMHYPAFFKLQAIFLNFAYFVSSLEVLYDMENLKKSCVERRTLLRYLSINVFKIIYQLALLCLKEGASFLGR